MSASGEKDSAVAEVAESGQLPSPNSIHLQLPSEPEPSVKPPEKKLPDLGKFPFQRRRPPRATMNGTAPHTSLLNHGNSISKNTSPLPGSASATMQPTAQKPNQHIPPQPQSIQQDRPPPQPQIVHVRGVGPANPQPLTSSQNPIKGGTMWPEDNKRTLAEAASKALTSGGLNAGKVISVDEIVRLLDQNPSYTELCEKLEHRGFIINRGHFARLLLTAVSGADKPSTHQNFNSNTPADANGFHPSMNGDSVRSGSVGTSSLGNGPKNWLGLGIIVIFSYLALVNLLMFVIRTVTNRDFATAECGRGKESTA